METSSYLTCLKTVNGALDRTRRFIKRLKLGRAAGYDGITAEHLKHCDNPMLLSLLSMLFNSCVQFGMIPATFKTGILVPILKKPGLDPSKANHYRPIIVSSVISKLLEYAIIEDSSKHVFHPLQYGFVDGRGTKMAISTTQDIITYCNNRGSPVYTCGLDVEKAFDGVPHCVLLHKSLGIIDDKWWRILYVWYHGSSAMVKHMGKLSQPFSLKAGTRQGGLTSPLLFNIVYQDMISMLSTTTGGLRIKENTYNVICYADDLLLMSLTVTGLQRLINCANEYVTKMGISFNADKSVCAIFGKKSFMQTPEWTLNGSLIELKNEVEHLGAILHSTRSTSYHIEQRLGRCRRAFYSLQAAGMCENGVKPCTKGYLWNTALQPVLLYATDCLPLRKEDIRRLETLQAKLVKASLGLHKFLRTTPLIQAMNIKKVETLIDCQSLKLLKGIMFNDSKSKDFYLHLIRTNFAGNTLLMRVKNVCDKTDLKSICTVLFNDVNTQNCIKKTEVRSCQ